MTRHTKLIALLVVALMTLSVVAMGGAFAASTTGDSDWSDSETDGDEIADNIVADFSADENETSTITVETNQTFDADDTDDADISLDDWDTLEVTIAYENVTHTEAVATDDEDDDISLVEDSGDSAAEADFEIDHDDLDTLPGQAGNGTIVDVTVTEVFEDEDHGDADDDDMVEIETEFVTEFQFDQSHSVVYIADDDHDAISSMTERDGPGLLSSAVSTLAFWSDEDDDPDIVEVDDERNVHYETHNSTFILADSDVSDGFDVATEGADGLVATATGDETILGATVLVDGELVPVFDSSAADWYDTDDTHAVIDGNEVIVEYGDDVRPDEDEDAEEVEVQMETENALESTFAIDRADVGDLYGDEFGVRALAAEFGWLDAIWM